MLILNNVRNAHLIFKQVSACVKSSTYVTDTYGFCQSLTCVGLRETHTAYAINMFGLRVSLTCVSLDEISTTHSYVLLTCTP